jgi:hypothetical protein
MRLLYVGVKDELELESNAYDKLASASFLLTGLPHLIFYT